MGKLILISGGNDSGKSSYGESLIGQIESERYYIATMIPNTEDNYTRIEKHRLQRKKYEFYTLELPYQVGEAPVTLESVVLLEDVSNLLANNIFDKGRDAENVWADICKLLQRCKILVAVTISGLEGNGFNSETQAYINSLNKLNKLLFDAASVAVTMQNKIPVFEKGMLYDIF